MLIFALLILVIVFLNYVIGCKDKYLKICCVLILLVMCFRDETVGVDTGNYLLLYRQQEIGDFIHNIIRVFDVRHWLSEPLWYVYLGVLRALHVSGRIFLCITSCFLVYSVYWFIKHYSDDYMIALITYIMIGNFLMNMSGLRQSIAMAIVTFSFYFLYGKKPVRFCVTVLVAALFHVSAFIFMPAYLILWNMKIRSPVLILGISTAFGIVASNVFFPLVTRLGIASSYLDKYSEIGINTNPLLVLFYFALGAFIVFIYRVSGRKVSAIIYDSKMLKRNMERSQEWIFGSMFLLFGIALSIWIVSMQNTMVSRLSYYYMLPLPVIISNAVNLTGNVENRRFLVIVCFAMEIVFFIFSLHDSGIGNYRFFWQG